MTLDSDRIGTSTEALSYPSVPDHLVVIGAGVIGLELGSVWSRLGSKVTVLEYLSRILPGMDEEIAAEAKKTFERQGITFRLGVRVTGARAEGDGAVVEIDGSEPVRCDRVLVCVGRVPNTDGLGLDAIGIVPESRGQIAVDEHFRTKAPGVYAIGDVVPGPMLAHKAEDEGVACVEHIATGYGHVNYDAIPSVVYTHPEIASVGRTEEELKQAGTPYEGDVPVLGQRSRARPRVDGGSCEDPRPQGNGSRAGRSHHRFARGRPHRGAGRRHRVRRRARRTSRVPCHAHPTLAEAVKEAALAVAGRSIHI